MMLDFTLLVTADIELRKADVLKYKCYLSFIYMENGM